MRRGVVLSVLGAIAVSGCAAPPPPGSFGYGTPGVSQIAPAGEADDLAALVARCRTPASPEMAASCAQLRTTMRNQPGNTVERR